MRCFFGWAVIAAVALMSSIGVHAQQMGSPIPPRIPMPRMLYYNAHPSDFQRMQAALPRLSQRPPRPPAAAKSQWQSVATPAPSAGLSNPMLLTDGTVLIHVECTATWYKLTPSNSGSYVNGRWSKIAALPAGYRPLYFASQILNDGRLVINGGEYNDPSGTGDCGNGVWTNRGAIYDPVKNLWTALAPPSGWTTIGDAQSIILPNTKYMLANCCTKEEAILNTASTPPTWSPTGSGKSDSNDEEGWALMHDGTVLTADAYTSGGCGLNTERYNPSTGAWTTAGSATTQLSDCSGKSTGTGPSYEVGPVVVRPDGSAVAFSGVATGAAAGTSVYKPSTRAWSATPNVPAIGGVNYDLADAPAAVLPTGNVLFGASPGLYQTPIHYFEFTRANTIVQKEDPPGSSYDGSYFVHFLVLPTGQVLQTDFSTDVEIYTPLGPVPAAWAPVITSVPATLTRDSSYQIAGKQINGLSNGVYGDDAQGATNFALVRITNTASGHVFYAKTISFSTRSDAPSAASTATFVMPAAANMEAGPSSLVVVANGIPSAPQSVTVN